MLSVSEDSSEHPPSITYETVPFTVETWYFVMRGNAVNGVYPPLYFRQIKTSQGASKVKIL
jgi:hypothetical protein